MADIQKFLDRAGTSTLWSRVAAELNKKATIEAVEAAQTAANNAQTTANEAKQAAATNATAIQANTDAIAILNSEAGVEGSVAYKITKMVLESDGGSIDKITEIAAWIADHPADAAEYNQRITENKEAIDALKLIVGEEAVATQIANAIDAALKVDGVDKYALASDLSALVNRVKANEDAIAALQGTVGGHTTDINDIKTTIEGIVSTGGEANLINGIKVNGVVQAPVDKVVDIAVPQVSALSTEEIDAAIAEASVKVL